MKQLFLFLCIFAFSALYAVDNNVELLVNGNFNSNVTFAQPLLSGVWYVGDNTIGTWNTAGGFIANASTGALVTSTGALPINVYNNFLGQITTDATINTGRYRFSINASGTQPFYIKISSTTAVGTELAYMLINPSSAAIEKQGTADYSGYSLKITPQNQQQLILLI